MNSPRDHIDSDGRMVDFDRIRLDSPTIPIDRPKSPRDAAPQSPVGPNNSFISPNISDSVMLPPRSPVPDKPSSPVRQPRTPAPDKPSSPVRQPRTPDKPSSPVRQPKTPAPESPVRQPRTPDKPSSPVQQPKTPAPESPVRQPTTEEPTRIYSGRDVRRSKSRGRSRHPSRFKSRDQGRRGSTYFEPEVFDDYTTTDESSETSSDSSHTRHRRERKKKKKPFSRVKDIPPGLRIPDGYVYAATDFGGFIIPDYDTMSQQQRDNHRAMLTGKIETHNVRYGKRLGEILQPLTPEENLTTAHLRYARALKMVSARKGADYYKYFLFGGWAALEFIALKLGIKALGYTESQVEIYDIYETYLIEMGELHGFGENWPPWVKLILISLGNLVVLIVLNHFLGGIGKKEAMQFVSGCISGKNTSFAAGPSRKKKKKKKKPQVEVLDDSSGEEQESSDESSSDDESSSSSADQNPLQAMLGTFGGGNFDMGAMANMMTGLFANMQQGQQKVEPEPTPEVKQQNRARRRVGPTARS